MRITPALAALFASAALLSACDDEEMAEEIDTGEVRSGEAGSGGTGLSDGETATEAVSEFEENPEPPEEVAEDPDATPGDAGPNRLQSVDRSDSEDGVDPAARTGSAAIEGDRTDGFDTDIDPRAAEAAQEDNNRALDRSGG